MKLNQLLKPWVTVAEQYDREISDLSLNSQKITTGNLFFALLGSKTDGFTYVDEAIKRGAVAIVAEALDGNASVEFYQDTQIPLIRLPNMTQLCSKIASRFYGEPSKELTVIGITGTNGKTSCAYFLAAALSALGKKAAYMGTLGYAVYGHEIKSTGLTTADPITIQKLLAEFREHQVELVAMEVSSHALIQGRVSGVHFTSAVFTNLTQDHLDYHGTMAEYWQAKKILFTQFKLQHLIINADDEYGMMLLLELAKQSGLCAYTQQHLHVDLKNVPLVYADNIEFLPAGITATVHTPEHKGFLNSHLLGRFNLSNLLAVLGTLTTLGVSLPEALHCIETLPLVPGRMQVFRRTKKPMVVVDYAHTPDALKNVLLTLRENCVGALWCVFGCGGDRDKTKRPLMAEVVEQYADKLIITDDNPRTETSEAIVADMITGLKNPDTVQIIHDRATAIKQAIESASENDIILIAGKGHEDYQDINGKKHHFSDVEQVLQQFKS